MELIYVVTAHGPIPDYLSRVVIEAHVKAVNARRQLPGELRNRDTKQQNNQQEN